MPYRRLGSSGLKISALSFGSWVTFGRQIDVIGIDGAGRKTIYSRNTTVSHPAFLPDGKGVLFLEEPKARGIGNVLMVKLADLSTNFKGNGGIERCRGLIE